MSNFIDGYLTNQDQGLWLPVPCTGLVKTIYHEGEVTTAGNENQPVKMNADNQITVCEVENDFIGVARVIDNALETCSLDRGGVGTMKLAYTGDDPSVGWVRLVASATAGAVKLKAAGAALGDIYRWAYAVDTTNKYIEFFNR